MKKFLGLLLTAIGLGGFCAGFYFSLEPADLYNTTGIWLQYKAIFGLLTLAGLAAIWKGRKLYREDGEGPAAKKVSGVLITITGLFLAVFGNRLSNTYYYDFELLASYFYIVLGIILAVVGITKFCAGMRAGKKAAAPKATMAVKTNPPAQTAPPADVSVTPPPKEEPKGMVCPDCGKKYPLGQVYCDECGALLKGI